MARSTYFFTLSAGNLRVALALEFRLNDDLGVSPAVAIGIAELSRILLIENAQNLGFVGCKILEPLLERLLPDLRRPVLPEVARNQRALSSLGGRMNYVGPDGVLSVSCAGDPLGLPLIHPFSCQSRAVDDEGVKPTINPHVKTTATV